MTEFTFHFSLEKILSVFGRCTNIAILLFSFLFLENLF